MTGVSTSLTLERGYLSNLRDTGAIFEQHPEEGQEAQFKGSVVVYKGNNVEEVRGIIHKDIYATSGVWDLEKVQIFPVRCLPFHFLASR